VTQQKNIMSIKNINVLVSENEILYALSHISLISVNQVKNKPEKKKLSKKTKPKKKKKKTKIRKLPRQTDKHVALIYKIGPFYFVLHFHHLPFLLDSWFEQHLIQ